MAGGRSAVRERFWGKGGWRSSGGERLCVGEIKRFVRLRE